MYRTYVILRHTFLESMLQPIYTILVLLGIAILVIFGVLPFFTLGEDTKMFIDVALDVVLILVLVTTLFATSKSIYEEIEDRTMLTLMSKPLAKWEMLVGKYLGIILSSLVAVAILGGVLCLCTWVRIPRDYAISTYTLNEGELTTLHGYRMMYLAGLIPSLVQVWLQISVLAAIGVALSTRVPLVVNLPVVILLYIAGNLTRFMFPIKGHGAAVSGLLHAIGLVLPSMEVFDIRPLTVYSRIAVGQFASDSTAVSLGTIWGCLGISVIYAVAYAVFALTAGMWLFRKRELGGAAG